MNIQDIAKICHEANRVHWEGLSDFSQKHWEEAEEWQRISAVKGVEHFIANPRVPDSSHHDEWVRDKLDDGWVFGDIKDSEAKTHPYLVPFNALPRTQQDAYITFKSICGALVPLMFISDF